MEEAKAKEVAKLLASKFIARPDVKAYQRPNGDWYPAHEKIGMGDLIGHLQGNFSMGHYMLNTSGNVKLFALDIDLEKKPKPAPGKPEIPGPPMPIKVDKEAGEWINFEPGDPRETWVLYDVKRGQFEHDFLIYQLRTCANMLARTIVDLLEIPVAVAYSGYKGLHVYGFTGLVHSAEAREAAQIVLDHTDAFELFRGTNFYKPRKQYDDPIADMPQLGVEIFPKQTTLENKNLGNLMRLPLGRNLKAEAGHPHQAKFIDLRAPYTKLVERDPIEALTVTNQWAGAL